MKAKQAKKPSLLPTELSEPCTNLGGYLILIYGREKVGKTTLASQFPDALFLGFEPGTKALRVYRTDIDCWQTARDVIKELVKDHTRFQTIIVDTADIAFQMATSAVCKKLGYDHPSEGEWGKGWAAVKDEFQSFILDLQATKRGIVLLSHESSKEFKRSDGRTSTRIDSSMAKGAKDVLVPMLDLWVYYSLEGDGKRKLHIRGDDMISAGTRIEEGFVGISEIDAGSNKEEAYANLISAFETKTKAESKPQ